jgi:hypothetical protein
LESSADKDASYFEPYRIITHQPSPSAGLARSSTGILSGRRFCAVCHSGPGQPVLPTLLGAGLFILKQMLPRPTLTHNKKKNPSSPGHVEILI